MEFPSVIAIIEVLLLLDGGTILLLAITPFGEVCEIRLMQRSQPRAQNAGRLVFNDYVIPLRSPEVTQLTCLLRNAIFRPVNFTVPETQEYKIVNYQVSGAKINNALNRPMPEMFRKHCQSIITYVESKEYEQFGQG